VGLRGRVTQDRLEQDGDQVGYVGEAVRYGTALSRVGEQRECQRVAPAQLQQPLPVRRRDAGPGQQVGAVHLVEVLERMDRDHLPPAGIGAPRGGGWLAAREDHDVLGLQGWDEFLAQPAVDGTELLVPVHQQHGPAVSAVGARILGGMSGAGGLDCLAEAVWRRIDLAPIQQ
jgi:hypothetical protein